MYRILPFGAILIAIGLVFLYIKPTFDGSIATSKLGIEKFDTDYEKVKSFTNKEAQLTTANNAIPGDSIDRLNLFLPDGVNNIQIITDLITLAAHSNMTVSNFSVGSPSVVKGQGVSVSSSTAGLPTTNGGSMGNPSTLVKTGDLNNSLDVSLSAVGTYPSFRVFLSAIENSLRPLDVTSLTVHQSKTGVYTYDITVRIYWLPS